MAKLFVGVRIPNKAYERCSLENVDIENNVNYLRKEVSKRFDLQSEDIELVHCGRILEDDEIIKSANVTFGSTIHVFKKATKIESPPQRNYTSDDFNNIAELYGTVCGVPLHINSRITILQKVLLEYPEFRRNMGAQALIRDSVLFQSLKNPQVIEKVSRNYGVICDAASFIVKAIKKEVTKAESTSLSEESLSDMTSSSEEESTAQNPQNEQARIRRISRDQLTTALLLAGSASLNSLSNIAQRNSDVAEEEHSNNEESPAPASSTASATPPAQITPSMSNEALLSSIASTMNSDQSNNMEIDEQDQIEDISESLFESQSQYMTELQQMREMGIADDSINLQALILSNGNIEAAINLVFSGSNIFYNT